MPSSLTLPFAGILGFLLVLARVGGAFIFVPIPGARNTPGPAKIVFTLSLTLALFPQWPRPEIEGPLLGRMAMWMISEASFGLAIGLVLLFVTEAFTLGFQLLGLQAGYNYASTIDPNTDADSSVLQSFGLLAAGLFFFALDLHHAVLRAFAASLVSHPPGTYTLTGEVAMSVSRLAAGLFTTGFRLALPVMATLMLLDLSLALMGRINAQLQLLQVAFPAKMMVVLFLLSWLLLLLMRVYQRYVTEAIQTLGGILRI